MELPCSSKYPKNGLFSVNIIHFLYALHMFPAVRQSLEHKLSGTIILQTSQEEQITTYLHELPELNDEEARTILKRMHQLSAQILLSDCYDLALPKAADPQSELMEFFRHIRNACAHNGKFLINKKFVRSAKWRNLHINKELNGKPLFDFFAIGDVFLFLRDIEQHLLPHSSGWEVLPEEK